MKITITDARHTPKWETLEQAIQEATDTNGQLTRINRKDGGVDYRAPGEYELTYTVKGEETPIELTVG
jgi:hypothetical protein